MIATAEPTLRNEEERQDHRRAMYSASVEIGELRFALQQAMARADKAETELKAIRREFGWEYDNRRNMGNWAREAVETELNRKQLGHATATELSESLEFLRKVYLESDSNWIPRKIHTSIQRGDNEVTVTLHHKPSEHVYEIEVTA